MTMKRSCNHIDCTVVWNEVTLCSVNDPVTLTFYLWCRFFSQTWLRYVWLMLSQIRLSVCLSVVCRLWHTYRGFNFPGIFLHHIVAWPSGNSPTKNHEDRPYCSDPSEQISLTGVWLCDSFKVAKPPISSSHVWLSHPTMSFLLSYAADK